MRAAALSLLLLSSAAAGQVEVESAWSRATAPGAKIAAGYAILKNKGAASDRLVGATTAAARKVETHLTVRDGEIMRMREVPGYEIPPGGTFELKPGGPHLMFVDLARPFKEGDAIPVTLRFERAGEVRAEFRVGRLGPPPGHHKH